MTEARRLPSMFWWLGLLLLVGTVAGARWLMGTHRPESTTPPPPPEDVDIVCAGYVDAPGGVASLAPGQAGRVIEIPVHEGDRVKAGQVLLRLDDRLARQRRKEAEAGVAAAYAVAAEARQGPLQHAAKVEQQTAAVEAARRKLAGGRFLLQHRRELQQLGQVSKAEVDAANEQVGELEQLVKVEQSRLEELKRIDPEQPYRVAEAQYYAAKAKLAQAREAEEECTLRAPEDGKVLRIGTAVGDLCGPTTPQPPIAFYPDRTLIVRAELEQESVGRVSEGLSASVTDDSGAVSHTWTGRVTHVSGWVAPRRSILFEPGQMNDVRTAECIVQLDPDPVPLRIGQRVRVFIHPKPAGK